MNNRLIYISYRIEVYVVDWQTKGYVYGDDILFTTYLCIEHAISMDIISSEWTYKYYSYFAF